MSLYRLLKTAMLLAFLVPGVLLASPCELLVGNDAWSLFSAGTLLDMKIKVYKVENSILYFYGEIKERDAIDFDAHDFIGSGVCNDDRIYFNRLWMRPGDQGWQRYEGIVQQKNNTIEMSGKLSHQGQDGYAWHAIITP